MKTITRTLFSALVVIAITFSPGLFAQDSSGSAYGESLDLSIESILSVVTAEAGSGPIPSVSGDAPPGFLASDSLLGVSVNAEVQLLTPPLPATTVGILDTGVLEVETSGDDSPQANSMASVDSLDLEVLGTTLLPLFLGLSADEIVSTASATGTCGAGLSASGGSTLVNASIASDFGELAGITGGLIANPPPNFVLFDANILGGSLTIVLNEQIPVGDGLAAAGITVNAVHIWIDDIPIADLISEVDGEIVISQSVAHATCDEADLSLTIDDDPDPVTSGDDLSYTLTVENAGPDPANNVVAEQLLPPGVTYVSATPGQGACGQAGGVVTCDLGTLSIGASTTIDVVVTPTTPGVISTSASVAAKQADPNPNDNSDEEDTTVESAAGSADLSVTLSDSPDPVTAGNPFDVTANILNDGPDAATNTVYRYDIPPNVTITSVNAGQGGCATVANQLVCNLGTLPNAGGTFVEATMTALAAGTVDHFGSVESDVMDPNTANNQDTEVTTVEPLPAVADLAVVKTDSPDPVVVGEPLTYTLLVTNGGPDGANNVVLTDTLPALNLAEFVSATPSQGSCNRTDVTVTCNLGAIAAAGNASVTIVVIPLEVGVISNSVVVTSDVTDPDPEDNSDDEDTTVEPGEADLTITKVASPSPVYVFELLTYTITVSNAGPNDATMVEVVDTLPPSVELESVAPSQGSCSSAANVVTCDLGTIAAGNMASIVIEVTPTEPGIITNGAVVESVVGDPNPEDNDTEVDTEVIADDLATFLVSKTFSDGNSAEVSVTISCNTGLPLVQSTMISEGDPVNFVVGDFESGAMDCEVSETVPEGYTPAYLASGNSDNDADEAACYFFAVVNGHANVCDISNELQPVDVVVHKEWIDEHPEFQLPTWVEVTLTCNAPFAGNSSPNGNGSYTASAFVQPGSPGVFQVLPHFDGSSFCTATEAPEQGVEQDASDCEFLPLAPGAGAECTIVNTRLFAGIPTLSGHGLVLLALLMLGIGALTYRRYA